MEKCHAHRVVFQRPAASFLDHVKALFTQQRGDLPHLRVRPHQHPTGQRPLSNPDLSQEFDKPVRPLVLRHHFHPRFTGECGLRRNVILPQPARRHGLSEKLAHRRLVTAHDVHQLQHRRARTPRLGHRADAQRAIAIVAARDFIEERHIPTAPTVDRLLAVADDEHTAVLTRRRFIEQGHDARPLGAARVLELVEQPVIVSRIEPEIDRLTPQARLLAAHPLAHQDLHVVET